MKQKSVEIFIPGPSGRLEGKYFKNSKNNSPVAIILQPHPQYGGTMNNRVVQETFNIFVKNGFSVLDGARPLRRSIRELIENPVAIQLISEDRSRESKIKARILNNAIVFI